MSHVGYLVHSFDLLNVEHLDLVAQSLRLCDSLAVGVIDDEGVAQLTGRRPVVPLRERLELVRHLRGVAWAMPYAGEVPPGCDVLLFSEGEPVGPSPSIRLRPGRTSASEVLRRAVGTTPSAQQEVVA